MPTPRFVLYRKLMVARDKDLIAAARLSDAFGLRDADDFRDFLFAFRPKLGALYYNGRFDWNAVGERLQRMIDSLE